MRNFASGASGLPVLDPYYGTEENFEEVYHILEEAIAGFLSHLAKAHPLVFQK